MLKAVEGVYCQGRIELQEIPEDLHDPTRVVVMFLERAPRDLPAHGIDEAQAADLRARLATFAEEWEHPEMDAYDNYEAAKILTR